MADYDSGIPLSNVASNAQTANQEPRPGHASSFASARNEKQKPANLHRRQGGRRRHDDDLGSHDRRSRHDSIAVLNTMGKIYGKIVQFSPVTRHLVYIAPPGILLAVPLIALSATGHRTDILVGTNTTSTGAVVQGPSLFNLFLFLEISWLCIWAAKLGAWFLPQLFMFFCGIVSVGTRKYATVLRNMRLVLTLFFWALASWLTFRNLFNTSSDNGISWVTSLRRVFGAIFTSTCVLLAEKALVQLIGVSYHQRSFSNRIRDSKREVYLLGLLYDASRTLFPMYCQDFAEEDYAINDSLERMFGGSSKLITPKTGAATPLKLIGNVGRVGDKVTSTVGNIASEIAGKQILNPNSAHSIVLGALEKKRSSEALASRLWLSFVVEGRDALYLEDFEEVLGPAYKNEAEEAFYAIDSDMNGDVSLDEMIRKVVEIGKERKAISEGMKDIGQALRAFDSVLLFVVLLITVFIFLAWFKSSFITIVASAGTTLLSLSFIFAVTTQEFLGSCIFLFVKHPYDVGDRVEINSIQMVVDRISLLYTVFTRTDKMQIVQVPNIQLNNLWVDNISRSKAMHECIEINVSFNTTFEDVELLRLEMEKFVRAPENCRDFKPDFTISVGGVGDLNKMVLTFCIMYKSNWHDDAVQASRRSRFMCALALALKKIPMVAPGGGADALGGPDNPSYSVAVSDECAAERRAASAKAKDSARMVPVQSEDAPEKAREKEEKAISAVNAVPPTWEATPSWSDSAEQADNPLEKAEEWKRTRDIEAMRSDLKKNYSQRGHRKPGEGVRSFASGETGEERALSRTCSQGMDAFDEEAETGMPTAFHSSSRSRQSTNASQSQHLRPTVSQRSLASMHLRPQPSNQR